MSCWGLGLVFLQREPQPSHPPGGVCTQTCAPMGATPEGTGVLAPASCKGCPCIRSKAAPQACGKKLGRWQNHQLPPPPRSPSLVASSHPVCLVPCSRHPSPPPSASFPAAPRLLQPSDVLFGMHRAPSQGEAGATALRLIAAVTCQQWGLPSQLFGTLWVRRKQPWGFRAVPFPCPPNPSAALDEATSRGGRCIGHGAPTSVGNMDPATTERENQSRKELLSQAESPAPPGAAERLGPCYFGELRGQMLITHFLLPCKFFRPDSMLQRGIKSGDVRVGRRGWR